MSIAGQPPGSGVAIAIVGRACRYPGARTPAELWENVLAGRRSFRRIPPERISLADYHGEGVDSFYIREAAVLENWEFDRVAFRVAGGSHRAADHAHWLALETAARALADSGYGDGGPDSGLPREATGALVGNSLTGEFSRATQMRLRWPYVRRTVAEALDGEGWDDERVARFLAGLEGSYKAPFPVPGEESLAGGLANTIAGRIANHFDLHGGGYTVDGACASSLLAVANACSALAVGDLDVALAGGVDLSLDPFELVGFARTGAFARDSMRVFDRRSAGFLPGEGCGFVVLMRLEDAISDGRRIHAVIRGWGISSDGAGGLTRPEAQGQAVAIERAYRRAGFDPASVPLFEGHGTGTAVGDPAELGALTLARRRGDRAAAEDRPAAVGSVKALIGHTKAAAGVAGLLKATLALEAGVLPATVGCEEPHPLLTDGDDDGPPVLRALGRAEPWPEGAPLRAGVSAMGFGGINAHLALEGGHPGPARRSLSGWSRMLDSGRQDQELLVLAAADAAALAAAARDLAERARPLSIAELGDLAAELATGAHAERHVGPARGAVVAAHPRQAVERLEELARRLEDDLSSPVPVFDDGIYAAVSFRVPRLGFLFPGQAAPSRLGGGVWARRFEEVEAVYGRAGLPADGTSDGVATEIAQPAIVAASVAGLAVAERLGLSARVGLGHSLGEISALAWGGALSDGAALALARARGEAMGALEADGAGKGGMVSLGCSGARAAELCQGTAAVVAGYNAPEQTAVSGPDAALEEVVRRAQQEDVRATRLRVSHAFHSPAMAPAEEPLRAAVLEALASSPAARRLRGAGRRAVSTVTAEPMEGLDPADDPEIVQRLVDQLTGPVCFVDALRAADREAGGVDLWIEVGPGRILSGLVADCGLAGRSVALDVGGRDLVGLLSTVGAAFALGAPVDLAKLFRGRFVRPLAERSSFLANPCESAPARRDLPAVAAVAAVPPSPRMVETAPETPPDLADLPPFEVVRSLVAARAELPPETVRRDDRLLSDLHLNSISVGELVVAAARALGAPPPASPTDFADASVAEVAETLAALATESADATAAGRERESVDDRRLPPGVAGWVRPFVTDWRDASPPVPPAPPVASEPVDVLATPSDALATAVAGRLGTVAAERPFAGAGSRRDVMVFLPAPDPSSQEDPGALVESVTPEAVRLLLAAGQAVLGQRERRLVLVTRGAGAGFVRSLHLERHGAESVVVEIPAETAETAETAEDATAALADLLAAEATAPVGSFGPGGYREVRYLPPEHDHVWRVEEPVLRAAPDGSSEPAASPQEGIPLAGIPLAGIPLGSDDVVLVSGGGRGIAAECALALARKTGAALALLGRSAPESNDELAANLGRFEASGVRFRYLVADVTDRDAVAAAVATAEEALGPVTGLLHGAGRNQPTLVAGLDEAAVAATLAPKVEGLANLLAAVDPERLRLLVTFGSIIGRAGLAGEADYALANELLARTAERLRVRYPACRVLDAAWSVWSGVGMGERLGRLEHLLRDGITPIPPDQGVEALLALLSRDDLPASVVVAGRFGAPPTVTVPRPELPLARFLERPRVHLPGVELVADAELSTDTDPYLDEHVFAGERLFPAVLGLEAMAQAARALLLPDAPAGDAAPELVFEQVAFERPIAVPAGERVTLRTAVLATGPGRVQAVLRSSGTAFAVDHFRAVCRLRTEDLAAPAEVEAVEGSLHPLPLAPTEDLYDGGVLFHQGRFRRLGGYRHISATETVAEVADVAGTTGRPAGRASWFARHLPSHLLLGDPAARDAVIHSIQASIPHATVLPTGVERIVPAALGRPLGPSSPDAAPSLTVVGRERRRDGRDLVWDVEVHDGTGQVVERWEGLALRAVADQTPAGAWPTPLVAPFLERRFADLASGARLAVAVEGSGVGLEGQTDRADRRARSDRLVSRLLGASVVLFRRPDGRPETSSGREVSVAHAGGLTLAVAGPAPVGCDAEPVAARPEATWADLLGPDRFALAGEVQSRTGSGLDEAATRVWAAGEAIKKMGLAVDVPLTLAAEPTASASAEGWTLLRSGDVRIGVVVLELAGIGDIGHIGDDGEGSVESPRVAFALAALPAEVDRSGLVTDGEEPELALAGSASRRERSA